MSPRSAPRSPAGFTLLEVLVAFAILSIAVVAAIQGFAQGLRLLKASGDHQQAMLLADQKIREVVIPAEETLSGTEGPLTWERTITLEPAPELQRTRATEPWRVYRIAVRVGWGEQRQVELTTMRTTAEKPETPGANR
ncbi:MAG: type IV pilus modification PilV family protein [Candidatus Rokuibacteriota bacterium]